MRWLWADTLKMKNPEKNFKSLCILPKRQASPCLSVSYFEKRGQIYFCLFQYPGSLLRGGGFNFTSTAPYPGSCTVLLQRYVRPWCFRPPEADRGLLLCGKPWESCCIHGQISQVLSLPGAGASPHGGRAHNIFLSALVTFENLSEPYYSWNIRIGYCEPKAKSCLRHLPEDAPGTSHRPTSGGIRRGEQSHALKLRYKPLSDTLFFFKNVSPKIDIAQLENKHVFRLT